VFGVELDDTRARSFVDVYLGALIHDVNLLQTVFASVGLSESTAVSSRCWNSGMAASGTAQLSNGATWSSTWMLTPGTDRFVEELTFYFDDGTRRLVLEPPYGNIKRRGSQYIVTNARGTAHSEFRDDTFRAELVAFHDAVTGTKTAGATVAAATLEAGVRDIDILTSMFRLNL